MRCVRFIARPSGGAPDWVRDQWIGMTLPIDPICPELPAQFCKDVVTGARATDGGYSVDAVIAVDLLKRQSREAARWWAERTDYVQHGRHLVFCREACEVVDALPGLLEPGTSDTITLQQLLEMLDPEDSEYLMPITSIVTATCEWEKARLSPISRPLIMVMSYAYVEAYSMQLTSCASESRYNALMREGHQVLRLLHWLASENRILVEPYEVDRPLSWVDIAMMSGVVEQTDEGVTLTPVGKRIAQELQLRAQADSN